MHAQLRSEVSGSMEWCEVAVKKALVEFGLTEAEAELLATQKYVGVTARTPKIDGIRKYCVPIYDGDCKVWIIATNDKRILRRKDVRLIKCGDFVNSYFLA